MCGIAYVRLKKPLEYYYTKYGTWKYGLDKLYLLMEKQHNRGQEGSGLACVKLNPLPGEEYIFRERAEGTDAIDKVFESVYKNFRDLPEKTWQDPHYARNHLPYAGEIYLGHLRYSSTGRQGTSYVHPFLRRSNWKNKTLVLAGNLNLTNVDEVFNHLTRTGQHPRDKGDTTLILETVGHQLDLEVQRRYDQYKTEQKDESKINALIEANIDIGEVIRRSEKEWDGGYTICGMIGHGDSFIFRDPHGIRPAFYYSNDEITVAASERPVIQTVMNVSMDEVQELEPGYALIIKRDGASHLEQIRSAGKITQCSFERIYFSRGSDKDIYCERKKLGELLTPAILRTVDYDLENTVFSFIPNTAEMAFYGMMHGMENYMQEEKKKSLSSGQKWSEEELVKIMSARPRMEKIAIKDIKLRTFITQDKNRNDLAAHVYDITYGSVKSGKDNLVVIDDSIVRGTTLRQSIIKILDRLNPKKIVIVSSSPQIRFPDCYGIDMLRMSEFIAFKAAMELLKESGRESLINEVYVKSKAQQKWPKEKIVNYVKEIYEPFTVDEISKKIVRMLTPPDVKTEVEIVYQHINALHRACPHHTGDWYFSGDYPTPGGNRLVNNAFIDYIEGNATKFRFCENGNEKRRK